MGLYTRRNRALICLMLDLDPVFYVTLLRMFPPKHRKSMVLGLLIRAASY